MQVTRDLETSLLLGTKFECLSFQWLQKAVLLWMYDPAGRDASILRQALGGSVIDLKVATEVLCSRTPSQIQHLRHLYHSMFGVYLEHDIEFQASGDHKKVTTSPTFAFLFRNMHIIICI